MSIYKYMPTDWDDHDGWNKYYTAYRETGKHLDKFELRFDLHESAHFLKFLDRSRINKIWFPGCGGTLAPHLYATLGFKVWASDASEVAISIQEEIRQKPLSEYMDYHDEGTPYGELHLHTHDFRQPFVAGNFDCIVNIKAIQRLPTQSMKQAIQVHYNALRPNGYAIFSTMNVYAELEGVIKNALIESGFVMLYNKTSAWYQAALKLMPHVFMFGPPPYSLKEEEHHQLTKVEGQLTSEKGDIEREYARLKKPLDQDTLEITEMANAAEYMKFAHIFAFSG